MTEEAQDRTRPQKKPAAKKKTKGKGIDPNAVLELRWDLYELPSSQHRAGLAGLALSVAFLARKPDRKGRCDVAELDERGLTLRVDRAGMQALFDDVYAATLEEASSKSKWKGAEPKRVETVEIRDEATGKVRSEKRFVYDRVVPAGELVADWDPSPAGAPRLWLKLWQDLVWSTLRGVPAQREPYNARAEGRTSDDGERAWDELAHDPHASVELPSTYSLGAQARTAENVAFADIARLRFLLHFWPLVVAIYVPAVLQRDGKREFVGHALAVPEVSVLSDFVIAWEQVARMRGADAAGYVPRDAVIDLAAEAGLDVVRRCDEIISARQGATATRRWLSAVDVFHVQKDGNNVRMRGVTRIIPRRSQSDEYARVRSANYWSPIFRRQRITNVLEERAWWSGFGAACATTPSEMTFAHKNFKHDCRAAFTEVEMRQDVADDEMTLEHLVYRRVQAYVLGKTDRKYELSWSKAQGNPQLEKDYREKREKVGREAFLAVRSRTGADFVSYFTSTICSVPQHATEQKYLELARALTDPVQTERVRSLTLLALSAVS